MGTLRAVIIHEHLISVQTKVRENVNNFGFCLKLIVDYYRLFFTVNVESVGAMTPNVIFVEAVKILRDKCKSFLDELNKFN